MAVSDFLVSPGRVTVEWWTHEIMGLHLNYFIKASQTDVAYKALTV